MSAARIPVWPGEKGGQEAAQEGGIVRSVSPETRVWSSSLGPQVGPYSSNISRSTASDFETVATCRRPSRRTSRRRSTVRS